MNLREILAKAGFKGQALETAYAIAMAESGGRADAHNPNASTGDDSYGLFQINMLGGMGPERRKRYKLKSNEDLYDPLTNARIAYKMSGGGKNWGPWTTYTSGRYRQYLKGGDVAVQGGQGGGQGAPGEAAPAPAANPEDNLRAASQLLGGHIASFIGADPNQVSEHIYQLGLSLRQSSTPTSTEAPSLAAGLSSLPELASFTDENQIQEPDLGVTVG